MQFPFKTCRICQDEKPLSAFGKLKIAPDGLAYHCLVCERERYRKWAKENPEKYAQRLTVWRKENPKKMQKYRQKPLQENQKVAAELGVPLQKGKGYKKRGWTIEELKTLEENLDKSDEQIAKILGTRTPKAVQIKRLQFFKKS